MAYKDTDTHLREPREIHTTRSSGKVVTGLAIAVVVIIAVLVGASLMGSSTEPAPVLTDPESAPMIESGADATAPAANGNGEAAAPVTDTGNTQATTNGAEVEGSATTTTDEQTAPAE